MNEEHFEIPGLGQVAMESVYPHVFSNEDRGVGGLLIGRHHADGSLESITGAIPAAGSSESSSDLITSSGAWAHLTSIKDATFEPRDAIVGWYRSAPGRGNVTLSQDELATQRISFQGTGQVVWILDPRNGIEGLHGWNGDAIRLLAKRNGSVGPSASQSDVVTEVAVSATRVLPDQDEGWLAANDTILYPSSAAPTVGNQSGLNNTLLGIVAAGLAVATVALVIAVSGSGDKTRAPAPVSAGSYHRDTGQLDVTETPDPTVPAPPGQKHSGAVGPEATAAPKVQLKRSSSGTGQLNTNTNTPKCPSGNVGPAC